MVKPASEGAGFLLKSYNSQIIYRKLSFILWSLLNVLIRYEDPDMKRNDLIIDTGLVFCNSK